MGTEQARLFSVQGNGHYLQATQGSMGILYLWTLTFTRQQGWFLFNSTVRYGTLGVRLRVKIVPSPMLNKIPQVLLIQDSFFRRTGVSSPAEYPKSYLDRVGTVEYQ